MVVRWNYTLLSFWVYRVSGWKCHENIARACKLSVECTVSTTNVKYPRLYETVTHSHHLIMHLQWDIWKKYKGSLKLHQSYQMQKSKIYDLPVARFDENTLSPRVFHAVAFAASTTAMAQQQAAYFFLSSSFDVVCYMQLNDRKAAFRRKSL